jgi:hypothetical protein
LSKIIFVQKTFRCEVTFPSAPEVGTQESSYDLRVEGKSLNSFLIIKMKTLLLKVVQQEVMMQAINKLVKVNNMLNKLKLSLNQLK